MSHLTHIIWCNPEFHTLKAPRALDINWDGHGFSFGRFGNNQTNNCQPLRLGVSSNGGRTSSKCHIGDQMMLFLISLLGSSPAAAFCGTFVGGVGSEFYNSYSQAAMVRSGQQTTLTVQNDVLGEFSDFALVMPVTQVLPETAIKVIDPSVFDSIDTYSMPRLVSYTCDDFEDQSDTGWALIPPTTVRLLSPMSLWKPNTLWVNMRWSFCLPLSLKACLIG